MNMAPLAIPFLSVIAIAAPISTAQSHAYLVEASPSQRAHVAGPLTSIQLRFAGRADAHYSSVELRSEDGAVLASARQPAASPEMRLSAPPLKPGRYRVTYRVLSTDGDLVTGEVKFSVD